MPEETKTSKLENITAGVASAIIGAEYFLCYNNFDGLHASAMQAHDRFRWLEISNSYFGDTPELFAAILASGFVGNKVEEYGQRNRNSAVEFIGRNLPTLTAIASGVYYTMGETILPRILPGTADIKDVPAVVLTCLAAPFVTNYVIKKWKSEWKDKLKNICNSIN